MKELVAILPQTTKSRTVPITYKTYEYLMRYDEVCDVESTHYQNLVIPELDFLSWIEFCVQLQEQQIQYNHDYMKEVIPDDPQRGHQWNYFNSINENRLYNKSSTDPAEMLFYYIKDFDYYVMIRLKSHWGQLVEAA